MKTKLNHDYQNIISKALELLDKEHLFLILPDRSFPSSTNQNTGIGSPYSNNAQDLIFFLKTHGINGIQLGPGGITKKIDPSPYTGTLFSNSPLHIDLYQLTQEEWGMILSHETYQSIIDHNPCQTKNQTAYDYIYEQQKNALKEAYQIFKQLEDQPRSDNDFSHIISDLRKDFNSYISKNKHWLYNDALYEALANKHNNDYWPLWNDELDRNLFPYLYSNDAIQKKRAKQRIEEIEHDYFDDIQLYQFCQFISSKQKEAFKQFALENRFKLVADCQVAVSDRDFWARQDLFMEQYYLGVPPDYFSDKGQAWGFPVIDPEKMFMKNGHLGSGGVFLKNKFIKIFEENDGVRIDHIIGLIDPWVYEKNDSDARLNAARLYSSPDIVSFKKHSYINEEDLNPELINELGNELRIAKLSKKQIKQYGCFIEKIVIQAAKETDKGHDFILICEDLGTITFAVMKVMDEFRLSGIRVTQFVDPEDRDHIYRGENVESKDWIVAGTHDNDSLINWAKNLSDHEKHTHVLALIEQLYPYQSDNTRQEIYHQAVHDISVIIELKLAELFASPSKHIQIMFTDFFGMSERYNTPATFGDHNWTQRLTDHYENFYYQQLSKGYGVNLPAVLSIALEAKGDDFVNQHKDLLENLKQYAAILKKPV